jgi:serine/threonine-protein kinase
MRISIYEVQDKPLGQGGMGKVYLGSDNKGNLVAIKEMLAEYVTDADLRARFHQEVKISSQLEHPGIVKMYASFEENGNLYLVMEYIEGETIEQYVRQRGAIDEDESIRLICEMLSALGYAHQKGFVHRDIKPSNIMIRPNGSICLLDFGIAKDMNSNGLTVGQVTIGTDGYMSPEQAGGYNIDHRSDIYSLGCVLFYMLTGHHAIEKRANDMETRMAIIQNDFPQAIDYNYNISANTQKILNRATHKNMMQRFQSCREFELELSNRRTMVVDNNDDISVGRGNCDIIISHPKVSQYHADIRLEVQSGHARYLFRDRSSNGTMIDGKKIHNSEIEIYPQAHPVILLAGTAELKWNTVEETFRRKGKIVNPAGTLLNQAVLSPESVPVANAGQYMNDVRGKTGDEAFCSSCGAIIKKEAEICPHCGIRQKRLNSESSGKWVAVLVLNIIGLNWISRFITGHVFTGIMVLLLDIITIATLPIDIGGIGLIIGLVIWIMDLVKIGTKKWQTSDGIYLSP